MTEKGSKEGMVTPQLQAEEGKVRKTLYPKRVTGPRQTCGVVLERTGGSMACGGVCW